VEACNIHPPKKPSNPDIFDVFYPPFLSLIFTHNICNFKKLSSDPGFMTPVSQRRNVIPAQAGIYKIMLRTIKILAFAIMTGSAAKFCHPRREKQ